MIRFGWGRFKKTFFPALNANKKTITLAAIYYKLKLTLLPYFLQVLIVEFNKLFMFFCKAYFFPAFRLV